MQKKWLALIAAAMISLTGCSEKKEEVKEHKPKEVEQTEKAVPEGPEYTSPLTGVGIEQESKGRAVAVMINNHPAARPQSGLNQADIVYELLAEGDITRFLAIFQSEQPKSIGPVRSSRDYYIELAKGYDAFYVAHGYSPEAKRMLQSGYIDNINGIQYDGTLFKRASFRKAPHNSYISYENILKGAKNKEYNMEKAPSALTFLKNEELESLQGEEAKTVNISYFNNNSFDVRYEYDSELKKYKRYSNGELTADYESKEPVLLDNIFIVETAHKIVDNYGRREINLTSGGKGYLIQNGQRNEVEWKNVDGKILPFRNGKEAGFVPGKTWINVVPANPGIEKSVSFETE